MSEESARRIRAARGYAKMSQPALAEVLEISEGTVKNIELGKREPKRPELLAIAEACEVPMWFLESGWEGWRGDVAETAQRAFRDVGPRPAPRRAAGE